MKTRDAARKELNELLSCLKCSSISLSLIAGMAATGAARGALSSTLGYPLVVASKNPNYAAVTQYTAENSLYANMIGGVILSLVSSPVLASLGGIAYAIVIDDRITEKARFSDPRTWNGYMQLNNLFLSTLLIGPANCLLGTFDSVVGGLVLGNIPIADVATPQSNFAGAVGATGGLLSVLAIYGTLLALRLAYLIAVICQPENCYYSLPSMPKPRNMLTAWKSSAAKDNNSSAPIEQARAVPVAEAIAEDVPGLKVSFN